MSLEQHINQSITHTVLWHSLLALAAVFLVSSPITAQKNSTALNTCPIEIRAEHLTTSCLQKNLSEVPNPTITAGCSEVTNLSFNDSYHELAKNTGFHTGYFALEHWEKKSGDGGVDVTGAPNCILVEGANIAQVSVAPGRTAIIAIEVPTKGFATFDWKNIGGSNLLFSILQNHNNQSIQRQGFCRSALLQPGDTFAFQIENASESHLSIQIADFAFLTNAAGIIRREWTATTDNQTQTTFNQYIAFQQLPLANIIFPENLDAQQKSLTPTNTGMPVFDEDGERITLYDQHELDQLKCAFAYTWTDEWTLDEQGYIVLRHWQVTDKSGNVREHTQMIRPQDSSALQNDFSLPTEQPSAGIGKKTSAIFFGDDYNSRITAM